MAATLKALWLALKTPFLGAFATRAAKEVVKRIIKGNGTETELKKAFVDLHAIDAQAAIGQRSMRPFLQLCAGFVVISYLVMTVAGMLVNAFTTKFIPWTTLYTDAYYLIFWAVAYTTGYGLVRGWEKRNGKANNPSTAEVFRDGVDRDIKPPVLKRRSKPIDRFDIDINLDDTATPLDRSQLSSDLAKDEGVVRHIYEDTYDNPTFGIGHLITPDDPEHGLPLNTPISDGRIKEAFAVDVQIAIDGARRLVENFDELPQDARQVIVQLVFQLGENSTADNDGLDAFVNFLAAIRDRQFTSAAAHLLDSKLARKDSPARANRHADRLRALDSE